jgi:Patatin-like phospholipase
MDWPLPLWRVLREELDKLRETKLAASAPDADPDRFGFSQEDIADVRVLKAQITRRMPELKTVLPPDFAYNEGDPIGFLNQLRLIPDLYKAFPTLPESRYVQQQNPTKSDPRLAEVNRDLIDLAFAGGVRSINDKILPKVVAELHDAKLSALCFSGGGIRSATFCLGAVQGLAKRGVLDKFDYLSTVSGGGYLGGWLAAWTHWSDGDLSKVIKQLSTPEPAKLEPEPDPIFYLRNFSNYLTPRTGLFSVDTWTLGATYLRNLLLNWIVLLPLLIALLAVPRLVLVLLYPLPEYVTAGWRELAGLGCLLLAVLGFACAMFYQGIARPSYLGFLEEGSHTSGWARWWLRHRRQTDFLKYCLAPLMMSAFVLATYIFHAYLFRVSDYSKLNEILWLGSASALLGWLAFAISLGMRKRFWWDLLAMLLSALLGVALFYYLVIVCAWIHTYMTESRELYLSLAPPLVLIVFLLAATIFVGLATFWTDDEDREYWSRMGAWILIASFAWAAFGAISLFGPALFTWQTPWSKLATYGGSLLVSAVTARLGFSSTTSANPDSGSGKSSSALLQRVLPIPGAISIVLILAILAVAARWLVQDVTGHLPSGFAAVQVASASGALFAIVAAGLLGGGMSIFVDPNKYSLHAMYRNRLIRAYLGASRRKGSRRPNPFTGFDPQDNISMTELWTSGPRKLMPFINMTLNMVEPVSTKLAWQERKAESFTVTPLHAGSFWVGYRQSKDYARGTLKPRPGKMPITLGTATAISGAAVSPDMGYNSSPIVSMLLTLFNARLGWWLGNPGTAGNNTYWHSGPGGGATYLVDEALGRTNDEKPYVYLSDGGHFENLGLYEMVLRRCHTIVVIDAGCDRDFAYGDLGNAIRKIRIDLGISIELPKFSNFRKFDAGGQTFYCSLGIIGYAAEDASAADGCLIYIKPTIRGDEPADVLNYERQHRDFPHESTADQWFSESQFESYRALGEHEIMQILKPPETHEPETYKKAKEILGKLK